MREVYRISEFEVSTVVDGFWIVQYEGVQARGGAVAVLTKGQIFGGDSGFTYIGDYQTDGNSLKARVIVRNFLPDVPSIFGVQGDYELSLVGTVEGDVIKGKAVLVGRPGVGIVVRLTERI